MQFPCRGRLLGMGVGLMLLGLTWPGQILAVPTPLHAIIVGAPGALTTGVLARVRFTRDKRDAGCERILPWIALSMPAAAIVRLIEGYSDVGLGVSAAL